MTCYLSAFFGCLSALGFVLLCLRVAYAIDGITTSDYTKERQAKKES